MSEDKKKIDALSINGNTYIVEDGYCVDIYMLTDGNGPMGHYDRIHLFLNHSPRHGEDLKLNPRHQIIPAHNCDWFEFNQENNLDG